MAAEHKPSNEKFQREYRHTCEEAFRWRFAYYIEIMLRFADYLGRDELITMIKKAVEDSYPPNPSPDPDFSFRAWIDAGSEMSRNMMTWEVVEQSDKVHEIKVTECLWMETFKRFGATDIGYATVCHSDFCTCKAEHPGITLHRTRTLMQGDDCCDHRWVFEG
jgi:hypothetical protein